MRRLRSYSYRQRVESKKGIALIIVLAVLALVTALGLLLICLAQLHRQISFSSSGQNRAEILSRSAMDTTVADLISEIQAGSTAYTTNGVTMYVPSTNFTVIPCRTVSSTYPNLIKESLGGTNSWYGSYYSTAAPMRASSDPVYSTLQPSLEGRYVPSSAWSKPQLLSSPNPTPSWILITRQGPMMNAATLPPISTMADRSFNNMSCVMGRYAYAIYDDGGLLDVNVAGNGLSALANSQRGRMIQAALGEIPLVDNTPGSAADMNAAAALVSWRSATSSTNTNTWISSPTNTFLNVSPGDQAFVSRQDLLNYGTAHGLQSSAFQYLGVFSRELNAPNFTPNPNRPKVVSTTASTATPYVSTYSWTGPEGLSQTFSSGFGVSNPNSVGLDDTYNPSLLNYRDSSGNSIMKQRFPLSRISWLTYLGPIADNSGNLNPTGDAGVATEISIYENAGIPATYLQQGTPANIKSYFGLTWDNINNQWIYTSPDGSNASTTIKTFTHIPSTRTTGPDFFETLLAAISVGSIGRDAGPPGVTNEAGSTARGVGATGLANNVLLQDQNIYRHILQIGANIIDQYDPDSYPTAIMMGTSSGYTTVFGVESLPYVTRIVAASYQDYDLQQSHGYMETEVWNPHQPSIATPPASLVPTQIRFRAVSDGDNPSSSYSSAGHCYILSGVSGAAGVQPPVDLTGATPIVCNYSPGFATIPTLLTAANSSGGVSPPTTKPVYFAGAGGTPPYYPASFYGFDAGWHDTSNTTTYSAAGATAPWSSIYVDRTPQVAPDGLDSFDLEYLVGGVWRPYSVVRNIAWGLGEIRPFMTPYQGAAAGSAIFNTSCGSVGGNAEGTYWEWVHIDPRTDRFGVMSRVGSASSPNDGGPFPEGPAPISTRTRWSGISGVSYYPVPPSAGPPAAGLPAIGVTSYMPYQLPGTAAAVNSAQTSAFFLETSENGGTNNTLNANASLPCPVCYSLNWTSSAAEHGRFMETIADNLGPPFASAAQTSLNYYEDPDGVTRPGVGAYTQSGNGTDGRPMSMNANYTAMTGLSSGAAGTSQPVILNRPFRSVAELGYTFRDEPWKDIDFFTNVSGDAALLEAFSVDDTTTAVTAGTTPMVAGKINLNGQNPIALQALIYGVIYDDVSNTTANTVTQIDATSIAQALVARTSSSTPGSGPLSSKADLVMKFSGDLNNPVYASVSDPIIKRRREAAIRALTDAGSTRTWNLMIDIITQAGKYSNTSKTGDQFQVEGERHYWLHLALDRLTGRVIDEFLEPVND